MNSFRFLIGGVFAIYTVFGVLSSQASRNGCPAPGGAWSRTGSVSRGIAARQNDCLCVKGAPLIRGLARRCDEEVTLRIILFFIFNLILLYTINEMVF